MNLSIYITQTLHNLSWLLLASAFVVSDASFAASKQWNFEVLLDGKKIGYHSFLVKRQNNTTVLESQAEFNVKFLFFNAYSYTHKNVETWDGSCLTSISSNTDDNGKLYSVRGKRQEDRFLVTTGNDVSTLPTCPMSFAYWNPDMLDRPQLLNSQTGEYIPVKIRKLGEESLA